MPLILFDSSPKFSSNNAQKQPLLPNFESYNTLPLRPVSTTLPAINSQSLESQYSGDSSIIQDHLLEKNTSISMETESIPSFSTLFNPSPVAETRHKRKIPSEVEQEKRQRREDAKKRLQISKEMWHRETAGAPAFEYDFLNENQNTIKLELENQNQVKRKRGRPPKNKTENTPQFEELEQMRQQVELLIKNSSKTSDSKLRRHQQQPMDVQPSNQTDI